MNTHLVATINAGNAKFHHRSSMNSFRRCRAAALTGSGRPVTVGHRCHLFCRGPGSASAAVPADTLMKPVGAAKAPSADGFIQRWMILEPIPAKPLTENAVQAEVKKEYFPEQFTVIPHDGDKVKVGGAGTDLACRRHEELQRRPVSIRARLGKETSNVLFWAVTVVDCSSGDACVAWPSAPMRLPCGG